MSDAQMEYPFEGLEITETAQLEKMQLAKGALALSGFPDVAVTLLLSHKAPARAVPLLANIAHAEHSLWSFKSVKFIGRTHLAMTGSGPVIAFVSHDNRLEKIQLVSSLLKPAPVGVFQQAVLKQEAAAYLQIDCALTVVEQSVVTKKRAEAVAEQQRQRAEELAAEQAAQEQRREMREQRRQQILARKQLHVESETGKKLHGIPVIAGEWQCLADGTWCVLVTEYIDGRADGLVEHFVVSKKHGRVEQAAQTPVAKIVSSFVTTQLPEPVGTSMFEVEDDIHEVPIYASPDDIAKLKEVGVSGTEYWALKLSDSVFRLMQAIETEKGTLLKDLGRCQPFNMA